MGRLKGTLDKNQTEFSFVVGLVYGASFIVSLLKLTRVLFVLNSFVVLRLLPPVSHLKGKVTNESIGDRSQVKANSKTKKRSSWKSRVCGTASNRTLQFINQLIN